VASSRICCHTLTAQPAGGRLRSRAAEKWGADWVKKSLPQERLATLRQLEKMARARGQTLAQFALAWVLRLPAIASALTGASNAMQVEENVTAIKSLDVTEEELARIDTLTRQQS